MKLVKSLLIFLILISPIAILSVELYIYRNVIDNIIIALVATNFTGMLPASQALYYTLTKQHNMYIEFILFYGIVLCSGSYHLCDKVNYKGHFCTVLFEKNYMYVDFINSYFCIAATILWLSKFEYMFFNHYWYIVKGITYVVEYLLIVFAVLSYNNVYIPVYVTSLSFLPFAIIFFHHKEKYVENYWKFYRIIYFFLGMIFGLIAFATYAITQYKTYKSDDYWILHSFGWHIPVMLCPMFFFETLASSPREKSYFDFATDILFFCWKRKRYNVVSCDSPNCNYSYTTNDEVFQDFKDDEIEYINVNIDLQNPNTSCMTEKKNIELNVL